jgi:hypothetical protein
MKKLQKSFMVLVLAALMVSLNSCDPKEIDINIDLIPSMEATVGGEAWTSTFRSVVVTESETDPKIVIIGTPTANETADKTLILTINGTEPGTYILGPDPDGDDYLFQCRMVYKKTADAVDGDINYYRGGVEKIVITKIDKENKRISGTFESTGLYNIEEKTIKIENGTFKDLRYQ